MTAYSDDPRLMVSFAGRDRSTGGVSASIKSVGSVLAITALPDAMSVSAPESFASSCA